MNKKDNIDKYKIDLSFLKSVFKNDNIFNLFKKIITTYLFLFLPIISKKQNTQTYFSLRTKYIIFLNDIIFQSFKITKKIFLVSDKKYSSKKINLITINDFLNQINDSISFSANISFFDKLSEELKKVKKEKLTKTIFTFIFFNDILELLSKTENYMNYFSLEYPDEKNKKILFKNFILNIAVEFKNYITSYTVTKSSNEK